jgi:D-tagatose-1,6-bisphosphate aldolase subunit GatZ/KbaZ
MLLDEILQAQKRGEGRGIPAICSAHPDVIRRALKLLPRPLIEATCNQVNQYGGYTGMTPAAFVEYVRGLAGEARIPFERVLLGGDHLGPSAWQNEPAARAMDKASGMVADYVQAGFVKIHVDCSMRLADDPEGPLDREVSARRAARLVRTAEACGSQALRYVIGTEVPVPGGARGRKECIEVTAVEDARGTIAAFQAAFERERVAAAWERVIALVVQPGVEFGDDFIHAYQPEAARQLSQFIEGQPLIFEVHSTDYQTKSALRSLVRDHFAILKVGPALTFAFREAVFTLAMLENELFGVSARSNLIRVIEETMLAHPEHWQKYYAGTERQQAFKRKSSLSDRIRYYWTQPEVQAACRRLMENLGDHVLPPSLLNVYVGRTGLTARQVVELHIDRVLHEYAAACGVDPA